VAPSSSSRKLAATTAGAPSIRRVSSRSRSRVASWRRLGELAEERVGELVGAGAPAQRVRQLAADAAGDLDERAQRPRRLERDAAAPEHPRRIGADRDAPQQRRLADSGLAAHEHEPAGPARGVRERGFERVDEVRALEQLRGSGHRSRDIVQLRTNRVHQGCG
jgi:hypothetical protein